MSKTATEMRAYAGDRIYGTKLVMETTLGLRTIRDMDSLGESPRRSNGQKTPTCFKLEHSPFVKKTMNNIVPDMAEN